MKARSRGFTLVELMIVVAIVGVLASLAVVGYGRYIDSAKVSEAVAMVQSIRSAEESLRAETMTYYGNSTSWYPQGSIPTSGTKTAWNNPGHPDAALWATLGAAPDGPVRFAYRVNTGAANQAIPALTGWQTAMPAWPTPTGPWYMIEAAGAVHRETGSPPTRMVGSSLTGELFWENE